MTSAIFAIVLGISMSAAVPLDDPAKSPGSPAKVVIPFDFESKFDQGVYGQSIGDMIWKKIQSRGGFVIPESMHDVREWCQRNRLFPGLETPLQTMKDIVRKQQAGDIGIWGKVERVAGHDGDVYDLWIYIADFSVEPVKIIHKTKVRTQSVSEIPHLYIKEALDRLYGLRASTSLSTDDAVEEGWRKGPNLVHGDFEKGAKAPTGWDRLPRYVTWIHEEGKPKNRIIRFTFPGDVAETTGVLYYSDFFPIQAGARYRFQCRWRSTGSAVKVFVKCYSEVPGDFRSKAGGAAASERREVYRSQQNLTGEYAVWNVHTEEFTPEHSQYAPRWGRVMLYAYYPAGTVNWDDIVVKQISQPRSKNNEKP